MSFCASRGKTWLLAGAVALLLFGASVASAQPAKAPSNPEQAQARTAGPADAAELGAFLDGVMAAHMQAQEIPTAVIAVVRDGKLFFSKGYGFADREKRTPADPEKTLFRPGSVSKLFTWTAVMQLHERGLLDLDADVNKYLKEFQIPATFPQPITMKHLLAHTPGFEDGALGFLFVRDESKLVPLGKSLSDHVPWRVREPGSYSSYSNFGTALAGHIVANISGMTFEEYVEKNILGPLGMNRSTFREPLPAELAPDMATGYRYRSGVYKKQGFEFIRNFGPAGALSSTAHDMARFMIAHLQLGRLGDARILQEGTARQMHSQLYTADPRLPGMAHGFYEMRVNGLRLIGHAGDTQWFHTELALLPGHNFGLYVSYVTNGGRARTELLKAFFDRYFPQAPAPALKPPDDFKSRAARFAGDFRFTRHNSSKLEKLLALASTLSVSPTAENTLLLSGLGTQPLQFVETEPLLFQQLDGSHTLAFKEDANGGISHMFIAALPFMPTYRVPWFETRQFSLLVVVLALVLCLTMLVSAFYHRRESGGAAPASRWAIRAAVLTSLLTFTFVIGLAASISAGRDDLLYGFPASLKAVLVLPMVTSALVALLVIFTLLAWKNGWWRFMRRAHFTLFTLWMVALTWFYSHWNLLGFKY